MVLEQCSTTATVHSGSYRFRRFRWIHPSTSVPNVAKTGKLNTALKKKNTHKECNFSTVFLIFLYTEGAS
jgi:hypothetical protein